MKETKKYWLQKITDTIFESGCTVSKPMVESVFEVMEDFKKAEPIEQDAFVWNDADMLEFLNHHRTYDQIISKFFWQKQSVEAFRLFKQSKNNQPEEMRVGKDMICPVTKKHCDDECCPVGAVCNLSSGHSKFSKPSTQTVEEPKRDWEIISVHQGFGSITKVDKNKKVRYAHFSDCTIEDALSNRGYKIYSIKRLSDNQIFSIGDKVGYDNGNTRTKEDWVIDHFYIRESDGVLLARSKDCGNVELVDKWLYKNSSPTPPKERIEAGEPKINNGCNMCGGKLALIRGRYPKEDKREVCPTCTTERLEQINEISGSNYGKTCKA